MRLAAVLLPVLLLSGCAAAAPPTFGSQQGLASAQCVPLARGARVLIGDVLQTRGTPAAVRGVSLAEARGVRVLRSWLVTTPPGGVTFGASADPPTGTTAAQLGWPTRVAAAGATIPSHLERNVVLEVQRTDAAGGTASAIRVDTDAGEVDSAIRYRFTDRC